MRRAPLKTLLVTAGLVFAGLVIGLLAGLFIAAPSITDWRNACVSDAVVPHAGVPAQVAPGPPSDPYIDPRTLSSTPRPKSGPYPEHRRDGAPTTPLVVTPPAGQ